MRTLDTLSQNRNINTNQESDCKNDVDKKQIIQMTHNPVTSTAWVQIGPYGFLLQFDG